MSETITTRNIVILPSQIFQESAIGWSQQIAKISATQFVLDGGKYYPHITLYQAAYPQRNLGEVDKKLTDLTRKVKPFWVKTQGFSTLMGFIFLNLIKTPSLLNLHRQIVLTLNSLREGQLIPSDAQLIKVPSVPERIKKSIKLYGSALDMEAYSPHVTICHLKKPEEAERILKTLPKVRQEFEVKDLYLANVGPYGTVNTLLSHYVFG